MRISYIDIFDIVSIISFKKYSCGELSLDCFYFYFPERIKCFWVLSDIEILFNEQKIYCFRTTNFHPAL